MLGIGTVRALKFLLSVVRLFFRVGVFFIRVRRIRVLSVFFYKRFYST